MKCILLVITAYAAFAALACSANTEATAVGQTASSGSVGSTGATSGAASGSSGAGSANMSSGVTSTGAPNEGSSGGATMDGASAASGSATSASGSAGTPDGGSTADASAVTAPRGPSGGCSKAPSAGDNSSGFTKHDISVSGVDADFLPGGAQYGSQGGYDFSHRNYFLKLPMGYDPSKAYPLVIGGGGCGATDGLSGNGGGLDLFGGSQSVAIQIGLSYVYPNAAGACFADDFPDTPDLPYFDAMLAAVEGDYCVDRGKVFVAGYSSGAWEAIMLGCARGGVVRAIGTQAGGLRIHGPACNGMPVAPMMIAGVNDTENPIGPLATPMNDSYGSAPARDEFLKENGCTGTGSTPYVGANADPACVSYTGCPMTAPVVWCAINGDHGNLGSALGFWPFWSALPPD